MAYYIYRYFWSAALFYISHVSYKWSYVSFNITIIAHQVTCIIKVSIKQYIW